MLTEWAADHPNAGGILSPVINGRRHFLDISTGEKQLQETPQGSLRVGRFRFSQTAFNWAYEVLQKQLQKGYEWLIVDEVGPLELSQGKGFHSLVTEIINSEPHPAKLLFVVRLSLVHQFIRTYSLEKVKIIPNNCLKGQLLPELKGIVLCGGRSTRMGMDKALLQYADLPQWKMVHRMLGSFCEKVMFSVNEHQHNKWCREDTFLWCTDHPQYNGKGPLTGILSCLEGSGQGCFIVAVDYPLLKTEHLIELWNARNAHSEAVCFSVKGQNEPLVSILEPAAVAKLKKFAAAGGNSLNKFLGEIKTLKVELADMGFMLNINTEQEYRQLKSEPDFRSV